MMNEPPDLEWIFDPVPASGARAGGDPSAFVFDAGLDTFVREVLQNSTDQHVSSAAPVEVKFVLDVVEGERLASFRQVFRWTELQEHIDGVLGSAGQTEQLRFRRAVDADNERLLVLWVEDRNTTGLAGPEAGEGTFAALCRDRLFSQKLGPGAGGSFGLGKAVLWRFSRWSTVAFCTRPHSPQEEGQLRFIAKAALPWHETEDGSFAGDGWLGRSEGEDPQRRAVSVWDESARQAQLGLGGGSLLPDGISGTAIGVIGFEEPASDETALGDLGVKLWWAAERSFWPALSKGDLVLVVEVAGQLTTAPPPSPWRSLFDAYRQRRERSRLSEPGDVVVHPIEIELPAQRSGAPRVRASADLVVRLAVEGDPEANGFLCFRGAGMVVQRRSLDRLSAAARPFHAILVCGGARRDPTDADGRLEEFLRDAEPPSHDKWTSTPRLKQVWQRGYATALEGMWQTAIEILRRLVSPPIANTDDGPAALRRLFPMTAGVAGGRSESAFHFRDLQAMRADDGRWQFEGAVAPNTPVTTGWSVRVDARVPELGGKGTGGLVEAVHLDGTVAACRVEGGIALIDAPPGTTEVRFHGETLPSPGSDLRTCFELVVTGSGVP